MTKQNTDKKVSLLSLGCLKNQADSESLLGRLSSMGIEPTEVIEDAGVLLVNTCGFIEDAKKESLDAILSLAQACAEGQRLVVLGCLSGRYKEELKREMPEVDAFFGVGEHEEIARYVADVFHIDNSGGLGASGSRVLMGSHVYAPLKVAEGCMRGCTFCAIPGIRGGLQSRPMDEVIKEAESLLTRGVRELLLVAQDLSSYGLDATARQKELPRLLGSLANLDFDEYWVRPLYLYPTEVDEPIIEAVAASRRICKYFDIPLQHSEPDILKAMGRKGSRAEYLSLIKKIREMVPGVALRTTLIVGFPGETDDDFKRLLEFVEEASFDHLGAFAYSDEEGTRAYEYEGKVPHEVTRQRLSEVMGIQAEVSREHNEALLDSVLRVLVDEPEGPDEGLTGRLMRQAPDVDGIVTLRGCEASPGDFIDVTLSDASDYDLEGHCE